MVMLGFDPSRGRIPGPDMSFARLLSENRSKWEVRGQYAIWTGSRSLDERPYRLLERAGRKVICVERGDRRSIMHRVAADAEFTIENVMGYWLNLDVDSIWIDARTSAAQYCLLIVGGSTGKPDVVNVGWVCPKCGSSIASAPFKNPLRDFTAFLSAADNLVGKFNAEPGLRACHDCGSAHPLSYGLARDDAGRSSL